MEPLKPETKQQILEDRPQASPADIEEYERLLAERFTKDPDTPKSPTRILSASKRDNRLDQLSKELFGSTKASAKKPIPKGVSAKGRNAKAGDKPPKFVAALAADAGPANAGGLPGEIIPVTVKNNSNRNCTGGTVKLKCSKTGETKSTDFPRIAKKGSRTNYVLMTDWPDFIGYTFWADQGPGWAGDEQVAGGASAVTLPLP